jgi:hypothetical protein
VPIIDEAPQQDLDAGYDLSSSKHVDEIRREAVECMSHFFADKTFWAGGAIAKSKLYREENIKAVMEMSVMDALAIAYYCLEKTPPDTVNTTEKGWDVKLCFECLKQCARRFIPKCHAGGMILVYLAMCHGVNYVPVLKKLKEIRAAFAQKEREEEIRRLMREQEKDDQQC